MIATCNRLRAEGLVLSRCPPTFTKPLHREPSWREQYSTENSRVQVQMDRYFQATFSSVDDEKGGLDSRGTSVDNNSSTASGVKISMLVVTPKIVFCDRIRFVGWHWYTSWQNWSTKWCWCGKMSMNHLLPNLSWDCVRGYIHSWLNVQTQNLCSYLTSQNISRETYFWFR